METRWFYRIASPILKQHYPTSATAAPVAAAAGEWVSLPPPHALAPFQILVSAQRCLSVFYYPPPLPSRAISHFSHSPEHHPPFPATDCGVCSSQSTKVASSLLDHFPPDLYTCSPSRLLCPSVLALYLQSLQYYWHLAFNSIALGLSEPLLTLPHPATTFPFPVPIQMALRSCLYFLFSPL